MKKVALITGGSRGIGFGIAKELARNNFDMVIMGLRLKDQVSDALQELNELGADVLYCQGNVALKKDRDKVIQESISHFNRLNVLVNNAGMAPRQREDILKTTEKSYMEVLDTNLKGPFFLTQAVAGWMIDQKKRIRTYEGCIINISSVSAVMASIDRSEYCISKAGVSMATKLFATRLGEFDIPVYEVRPGVIRTDMTAGVVDMYDQRIADGLCVTSRWGYPEDIGMAVAALASGQFPYATGQVMMVDGGLTIPRL